jgi:hypothetical protein
MKAGSSHPIIMTRMIAKLCSRDRGLSESRFARSDSSRLGVHPARTTRVRDGLTAGAAGSTGPAGPGRVTRRPSAGLRPSRPDPDSDTTDSTSRDHDGRTPPRAVTEPAYGYHLGRARAGHMIGPARRRRRPGRRLITHGPPSLRLKRPGACQWHCQRQWHTDRLRLTAGSGAAAAGVRVTYSPPAAAA